MTTAKPTARVPWNHGRVIGPKPPLKPKHIWRTICVRPVHAITIHQTQTMKR